MKTTKLPSALHELNQFKGKSLALFLDYDGTLTPIVANPSQAYLANSMRTLLKKLGAKFTLAFVSGRDLKELQNFIKLENVYYIGSHGYELAGPDGFKKEMAEALDLTPLLDAFEAEVGDVVQRYPGAGLERKRFSIAVHYRNITENKQEAFRNEVEEIGNTYEKMRWGYGKKVLELQPKLDWNKGKALLWLSQFLQIEKALPIYIGDDLTDEDAFKVLKENGIGIVVCEEERETEAKYILKSTQEVELFLARLIDHA